jgi:hypothetical protein
MWFLWESHKHSDHQEELDICGRIILRWISEKYAGVISTGFIWLRIGTCGGLL